MRERQERLEQRRLRRTTQRGIKGSGTLSLTGWKAMQEKLLESERGGRACGAAVAFREGDERGVLESPDRIPSGLAPSQAESQGDRAHDEVVTTV